jgi:hypothetical protein
LIEQGFPFIKAQLLFENPYQLDLSDWEEVLQAHDPSHTLVDLAQAHLKYLARTRLKQDSR